MDKLRIGALCYTSEWMQCQFLEAFNRQEIQDKFKLVWIAGKESSLPHAEKRIIQEVQKKMTELDQTINTPQEWRTKNMITESKNLLLLLERTHTNGTSYKQMNRNQNNLPQKSYDDIDAVAIFTPNAQHLPYLEDAVRFGKPAFLEKPLTVVQDLNGAVDKRGIEDLIEINEIARQNKIVIMDAEHYSSKISSKIFFDNINEMVKKYGKIIGIEGKILEKDDPKKPRTKSLLCMANQTGLLLDTGVHLSSMLTGIGGEYNNVKNAKYAIYPDYNVETYAEVELEAFGPYFQGNIPVRFKVSKFINLFKQPLNQEEKQITFNFKNPRKTTAIKVDFKTGEVTGPDKFKWRSPNAYSTLEYVNVLNEFYDCITNKHQPRTCVDNSIKGLDIICKTYEEFPINKNLIDIYAK